MNFVGKFDAKLPVDGTGAPHFAHTHVDAASTHAPADAIIVPDAKLLFEGDFKRSGVDLVLSKDGQETVVHDYFKGEKRAPLSSPDGAHLTGDIVNALAGHVEYAQAGGGLAAAAAVVGHVTKLMGSATAIRNGVSIILNQGDNIEKGDVLQSGADSTVGVTFIDGTVFGLSSNARMVVNEMVYDPNGSNNSSLLSLVAGTISFVAGETAKHGDMKVDTPVATMGIRGTAVLVEIDFGVPGSNGAPSANFQVLVEPDGTTGSYILFDKTTLTPLATVNAAGTLTKISQGVVSFQSGTGLTPEEQRLITDVFQQKFTDNSNPKSLDHQFTDSITPQLLNPIKLLDGLQATPVVVVVQGSGSVSQTSNLGSAGIQHIPGAPAIVTFNQLFNEHINATGSQTLDTVITKVNFADINAGDLPTVSVKFTTFTYQTANQVDITHVLTPAELAAVQAVEAIGLQNDEGNKNTGSATLTYSYPDGAFDFLGAGETLTLTYTAAVNNNFQQSPETAFKTFTITITGTNDVPVITSSVPQAIAFNGGTSVPGGNLTTHVPTSGTITFDDPDLTDTHTVSVTLLPDGLNLPPAPLAIFEHALTASIVTDSTGTGFGTVNWTLADLPVYLGDFVPEGQTITLTYAVTVTDSQGATSTQDITVTITGTDTPAVVWIATTETGSAPNRLLWSNASNWETGTVPTINDDAIVITNQLIGLTPSFPVTIDAPAEAKSLTMNDFGSTPPEVINQSTLTIANDLNMAADSIIHNAGTIRVGGLIEVQDTSVLDNSGTLVLQAGGDFSGQSIITNTGTIELSGGTLHVGVDIVNSGQGEESVGGLITIDSAATLALDGATLSGGTVNDNHLIDITGSSAISGAHLNYGSVTIESGQTLTLDGDTVTGTGFTNAGTGSAILVDGGDSLSLNSVTVSGGGFSVGAGALVKTSGNVTLTNTAVTNDGTIEVTGGTLKIAGGSVASDADHSGSIQIDAGAVLDLDGADSQNVVFNGANAELKIDTSSFDGTISGLAATDEIDLSTIGYGPGTTATYSGGVLTLTDGTHAISMTLSGDYSNLHFAGSSDGHGGTLITLKATDDAPVFAAADKAESVTVSELLNTTGSSALDPAPAASGTLHFTDIDLTDRPTASVALSFSWTNGTTDLTSSLTPAEISALENAFALSQSGNTNNGSLGWTYQISDSALDFLGAGATAKVTATITLDDHQGGTDTATVTVTLDGANDTPVIVGETNPATQTINLAHSPAVLAAGTSTNALGFHTETFDEQGIPVGSASNNGAGHGSFHSDALDATFTSSGNAGVVNGPSSVTAPPFIGPTPGHADSTNYLSIGAHGSETITFATEQNSFGLYWGSVDPSNTISFYDGNRLVASYSGADIAPLLASGNQGSFSANGYVQFSDLAPFTKVVLASSTNAFEVDNISAGFHDELPAPITGTLTVNDGDIGDTLTASVTGNAVAAYNGSTTLPSGINVSSLIASGAITFDTVTTTGGPDVLHWTYDPSNPDLSFLRPGDTLTLTFNATVSDGHATTANQPLTITLVGGGTAVPAPAAPTVDITSAASTTNHASQTIVGTGEAGTTVTLYDNGTALNLPTITVDQTGHWSSAVTLAEGANSIVAHDTDGLGHVGTSAATTFTVDTVAPTVAIANSDLTTSHASQTITGTGEAGTTVTLFDNGTALNLPTITVDQTGHWSSTVTLAEGANSFVAHDTDAVGNVGSSAAVALTLDTTAPTVTESLASDTGLSSTDKITSSDALTGTGLADAVVHFSIDGTPIEATTTADAQGHWSFTPTGLADGSHTVVASETDSLGNTGTATLGFTLDTTSPDVTITSPGVTTATAPQTIHGTVADLAAVGTTVTVYDSATSGGSISALGASLLTAGHNLVNGMGGATGFGTQVLEAGDDNSSSAIDITSVFGTGGVNFFGHDYTSIYLNNNGNITFASPSGTYTPSSIDGGVNNPIIAPFWADVDTRGGPGTATPGGNSTGSNQVLYNLDSANGVLTITWDDTGYYSAATDKLDAFQVQLISLGNGNFDIVYRYENINWTTGSASGGSDGLGGTPARAGYSAGDGINYYELPESGNQAALLSLPDTPGNTGIPGVDVFQVINGVVGTPTVTAVVQADGTWSTDVTLTNGTNSLTAQDTDLAGNSGTSAPVTFTVDAASTAESAAALQSFAVADTETQPAHWLNATNGDFADASNWSNGAVPAVADDAVITATGSYTVTSTANESIHSIDLGANVTLDVGGGTFAIANGGENDGLIEVEHAGSVLNVGGTVTNTGVIEAFDEASQDAAPATVALNDAHITGGTVEAIAGGEISAASGNNSIDANVTIDANSSFVVDHGATVTVNATNGEVATTNDGVIEVQSGGNAIWSGALSGTGAIHIDNGASFELSSTSAASGQTVTFEGSTGSLTLDHPASFSGTISGFTGDGTLTGSDQIDLKGIDYNSHSFSETFDAATDTLSVTDGTDSAVLHFTGTYQAANFSFTTDNNGGTIVYDPPVSDNAAAKPAAVTANSNGFVFNFADRDAGGAHTTTDTHLFDGQTFVNTEADPNKPHDDGHAQAVPVPESMDAGTVAAVKAQLHAHDFHFA